MGTGTGVRDLAVPTAAAQEVTRLNFAPVGISTGHQTFFQGFFCEVPTALSTPRRRLIVAVVETLVEVPSGSSSAPPRVATLLDAFVEKPATATLAPFLTGGRRRIDAVVDTLPEMQPHTTTALFRVDVVNRIVVASAGAVTRLIITPRQEFFRLRFAGGHTRPWRMRPTALDAPLALLLSFGHALVGVTALVDAGLSVDASVPGTLFGARHVGRRRITIYKAAIQDLVGLSLALLLCEVPRETFVKNSLDLLATDVRAGQRGNSLTAVETTFQELLSLLATSFRVVGLLGAPFHQPARRGGATVLAAGSRRRNVPVAPPKTEPQGGIENAVTVDVDLVTHDSDTVDTTFAARVGGRLGASFTGIFAAGRFLAVAALAANRQSPFTGRRAFLLTATALAACRGRPAGQPFALFLAGRGRRRWRFAAIDELLP